MHCTNTSNDFHVRKIPRAESIKENAGAYLVLVIIKANKIYS